MERLAETDSPLIDPIRRRWSPSEFTDRPVDAATLRTLFDAAHWAASSFNEQPWRYVVASKAREPQQYATLLSCLVEANQAWAQFAPVLAISFVKKTFTRNGTPNRVALHDVGAASAQLTLQAESMGLKVHQMGGIEISKIRVTFGVPDDFDPVAGLAIGYPGHNPAVPDDIRRRDQGPRARRPLGEVVFTGAWASPAALG